MQTERDRHLPAVLLAHFLGITSVLPEQELHKCHAAHGLLLEEPLLLSCTVIGIVVFILLPWTPKPFTISGPGPAHVPKHS